ncbi:MAG: hypothetical protein IJ412_05825, partial [Oscillospiraceae bacterium]|nr:hypothetical protein [Oscillospiraceae bacterium]
MSKNSIAKRVVSFLLVFVLLLGPAAPGLQAAFASTGALSSTVDRVFLGQTQDATINLLNYGDNPGAFTWRLADVDMNTIGAVNGETLFTTSTSLDAQAMGWNDINDVATLNGTAIANAMGLSEADFETRSTSYSFQLCFTDSASGEETAQTFKLMKPYYDYECDYMYGGELRMGESIAIEQDYYCYYTDATKPYDGGRLLSVTAVEPVCYSDANGMDTKTPTVAVEYNDVEGTWVFTAQAVGGAAFRATTTMTDRETPRTFEFTYNVIAETAGDPEGDGTEGDYEGYPVVYLNPCSDSIPVYGDGAEFSVDLSDYTDPFGSFEWELKIDGYDEDLILIGEEAYGTGELSVAGTSAEAQEKGLGSDIGDTLLLRGGYIADCAAGIIDGDPAGITLQLRVWQLDPTGIRMAVSAPVELTLDWTEPDEGGDSEAPEGDGYDYEEPFREWAGKHMPGDSGSMYGALWAYPTGDGDRVQVPITNVEVISNNAVDSNGAPVERDILSISYDEAANQWSYQVLYPGTATVRVTYRNAADTADLTGEFTMRVVWSQYTLVSETMGEHEDVLPNDSYTFPVLLSHFWFTEEEGTLWYHEELIEDFDLVVRSSDETVLTGFGENGEVTINTGDALGSDAGAVAEIHACIDGESEAYTIIVFDLVDHYYEPELISPDADLPIGGTIDFADYYKVWRHDYVAGGENTVTDVSDTDQVEWSFDVNPGTWNVLNDAARPVVERTTGNRGRITCTVFYDSASFYKSWRPNTTDAVIEEEGGASFELLMDSNAVPISGDLTVRVDLEGRTGSVGKFVWGLQDYNGNDLGVVAQVKEIDPCLYPYTSEIAAAAGWTDVDDTVLISGTVVAELLDAQGYDLTDRAQRTLVLVVTEESDNAVSEPVTAELYLQLNGEGGDDSDIEVGYLNLNPYEEAIPVNGEMQYSVYLNDRTQPTGSFIWSLTTPGGDEILRIGEEMYGPGVLSTTSTSAYAQAAGLGEGIGDVLQLSGNYIADCVAYLGYYEDVILTLSVYEVNTDGDLIAATSLGVYLDWGENEGEIAEPIYFTPHSETLSLNGTTEISVDLSGRTGEAGKFTWGLYDLNGGDLVSAAAEWGYDILDPFTTYYATDHGLGDDICDGVMIYGSNLSALLTTMGYGPETEQGQAVLLSVSEEGNTEIAETALLLGWDSDSGDDEISYVEWYRNYDGESYLVGESWGLSATHQVHVNGSYAGRVPVTNVEVVSSTDANGQPTAEPVIEVHSTSSGSWGFTFLNPGSTTFRVTYQDLDGVTEYSYEITMHSVLEKYELRTGYVWDGHKILAEDSFTFPVQLIRSISVENPADPTGWGTYREIIEQEVTDYTLTAVSDNDWAMSASASGNTVTVNTTDAVYDGAYVTLTAAVGGAEVASREIWLNVSDEIIRAEYFGFDPNVPVGTVIDLAECFKLMHYTYVPGGENIVQDISDEAEWDFNWSGYSWEAQNDAVRPALKRIDGDSSEIIFSVNYEPNGYNYARGFAVEKVYDPADFSIAYPEHNTLLTNATMDLFVDMEGRTGTVNEMVWQIAYGDQEFGIDSGLFTVYTTEASKAKGWAGINDAITLNGAAIAEALGVKDMLENGGTWSVGFEVFVQEKGAAGAGRYMQLGAEGACNVNRYPFDPHQTMLVTSGWGTRAGVEAYVRTAEEPDGVHMELPVTGYEILANYDEYGNETDATIVSLSCDVENGTWHFVAEAPGSTVFLGTYTMPDGESTGTFEFTIETILEDYTFHVEYPFDSEYALPGWDIPLNTYVEHRKVTENENGKGEYSFMAETLTDYTLSVELNNEDASVTVNGAQVTVHAPEYYDWLYLQMTATGPNGEYELYRDGHITVTDMFTRIEVSEWNEEIKIGTTVDLNDYVDLMYYSDIQGHIDVTEEANWNVSYDPDVWKMVGGSGLPVLERIGSNGGEIFLEAYWAGEDFVTELCFNRNHDNAFNGQFKLNDYNRQLFVDQESIYQLSIDLDAHSGILGQFNWTLLDEGRVLTPVDDRPLFTVYTTPRAAEMGSASANDLIVLHPDAILAALGTDAESLDFDGEGFRVSVQETYGELSGPSWSYGVDLLKYNDSEYWCGVGENWVVLLGDQCSIGQSFGGVERVNGVTEEKMFTYKSLEPIEHRDADGNITQLPVFQIYGDAFSFRATTPGSTTFRAAFDTAFGEKYYDFTVTAVAERYGMSATYDCNTHDVLPNDTKTVTVEVFRDWVETDGHGNWWNNGEQVYDFELVLGEYDTTAAAVEVNGQQVFITPNDSYWGEISIPLTVNLPDGSRITEYLWVSVTGVYSVVVAPEWNEQIPYLSTIDLSQLFRVLWYEYGGEDGNTVTDVTHDMDEWYVEYNSGVWEPQNDAALPILKRVGGGSGSIYVYASMGQQSTNGNHFWYDWTDTRFIEEIWTDDTLTLVEGMEDSILSESDQYIFALGWSTGESGWYSLADLIEYFDTDVQLPEFDGPGSYEGTVTVTHNGKSVSSAFTIDIMENPITSFEITELKALVEGDCNEWQYDVDENGNPLYAQEYDLYMPVQGLRAVLADGSVAEFYSLRDMRDRLGYNIPMSITSETDEFSWAPGFHTVTYSFAGYEQTVEVEIIENPIESITFGEGLLYPWETHDNLWDSENQVEFAGLDPSQAEIPCDVVFKGESRICGFASQHDVASYIYDKYDAVCSVYVEHDQTYDDLWTVGNTYDVIVRTAGRSGPATVTTVESPIESVEITTDQVMYTYSEDSVYAEWQLDYGMLEIAVTYTEEGAARFIPDWQTGDSRTVTYGPDDHLFGDWVTNHITKEEALDTDENGCWAPGTHEYLVEIFAHEVKVPVQVIGGDGCAHVTTEEELAAALLNAQPDVCIVLDNDIIAGRTEPFAVGGDAVLDLAGHLLDVSGSSIALALQPGASLRLVEQNWYEDSYISELRGNILFDIPADATVVVESFAGCTAREAIVSDGSEGSLTAENWSIWFDVLPDEKYLPYPLTLIEQTDYDENDEPIHYWAVFSSLQIEVVEGITSTMNTGEFTAAFEFGNASDAFAIEHAFGEFYFRVDPDTENAQIVYLSELGEWTLGENASIMDDMVYVNGIAPGGKVTVTFTGTIPEEWMGKTVVLRTGNYVTTTDTPQTEEDIAAQFANYFQFTIADFGADTDVPVIEQDPALDPEVDITVDAGGVAEMEEVLHNDLSEIIYAAVNDWELPAECIAPETLQAVKEAVLAGEKITAVVELVEIPVDATDVEDKDILQQHIQSEMPDAAVRYMDITIQLRAGDEDLGTLNVLGEPMPITVTIPAELRGFADYRVISRHNGELVEIEDVEIYRESNTITFYADSFSTFALIGNGEIPTGEISKKTWSVSVESVIYLNYYMNIEGFEGVDLAKAGGVVVWTGE